ncbi:MAG: N-acetylmannosamine-6-phosphate 2-epimerase [Erysipelothrix sp.]|nr:N-acetylmannosamine-6-phosphate 2-epimerase [Erysipelothrix sp.]
MKKQQLLKQLKGGLIVSCQALENEPLYRPEGHVMDLMATAAVQAGAVGIRAQGVVDIVQIKEVVDVPVIGIIKKSYEDYEGYITMTWNEIDALVETGCDIIALDCTDRARGDGLTAYEFVRQIKEKYPEVLLMADVSTVDEGIKSIEAGVDFVGTTLSGYTPYSAVTEGPNFDLIHQLATETNCPIIAEGKIHTPQQAAKALDLGAFCVVVGGAITRPQEITARFKKAIDERNQ